jgi:cell fate (sporulation/competence/biofilm development) regulator YlbF (YheA/YmcA/DUF963 family)
MPKYGIFGKPDIIRWIRERKNDEIIIQNIKALKYAVEKQSEIAERIKQNFEKYKTNQNMESNYIVGRINFAPHTTFNTTKISTIMEEEDTLSNLRAELDMMLRSLEIIKHLNSMGKTLKIDEEITAILNHYNR